MGLGCCTSSKTINIQGAKDVITNEKLVLTPDKFHQVKDQLKQWHPNIFAYMTETEFDSLINQTARNLPSDSISEPEFFYQLRRVFDNVTMADPHFRFICNPKAENSRYIKYFKVLPFTFLKINDSLLVDRSFTKSVFPGDRLLKIDDIAIEDFMKYSYNDRYFTSTSLLSNYNFHFRNDYKLTIERNGDVLETTINGLDSRVYGKKRVTSVLTDSKNGFGYIQINEFRYNKFIIKKLSALVDQVKQKGGNTIIIDIRKNPGGNGDDLDELLSVMSNKSCLPYSTGEFLKMSELTLDYGFPRDSIGKLISLPDSMFFKKIPLMPEKYKGAMNYYVMVSENTGSMAAALANVLQYNGIATIVGEPLKRNATLFGDVCKVGILNSYAIISTSQTDFHTKAIDGILYPEIHIPYIASEYMKGGDPVLEKLLEYLKGNGELNGK